MNKEFLCFLVWNVLKLNITHMGKDEAQTQIGPLCNEAKWSELDSEKD